MCTVMAHKRGYGFDAVFCRLAFVVFVGIFLLFSIKNKQFLKTHTKTHFFGVLLMSLFYFISVLWAKDKSAWNDIGIINSMIQILVTVFILEATSDDFSDCKAYLKAYLFAVIYMMVWLVTITPAAIWGSVRLGAEMGLNANSLGLRCATAFIVSVFFAREKGKWSKCYLLIAMLAACIALFSGSRKAFLILILGFAIYWCGNTRGWRTLLRIVMVLIAVIGVIYLVMTHEGLYQVLGKRLERGFYYLLGERNVDMSSQEREFYRNYAFTMFINHPILGYGGNGFVGEMHRIHYSHVAYSHCNYAELLATLGVVGFLLYYRLQGKLLIVTVRNYLFCKDDGHAAASLALAIVITNLISEYYMVSYYSVDKQSMLAILFIFMCRLSQRRGGNMSSFSV